MAQTLEARVVALQKEVEALKKERPANIRLGTLNRVVNAVPAPESGINWAVRFTVPNSRVILCDIQVEGNLLRDVPLIAPQTIYRFYETYDLLDVITEQVDSYIPEPRLPERGDPMVVYWDGRNLYLTEPMVKIVPRE